MKWIVRYRWMISITAAILCLLGGQYIPVALKPNNDIKLWFEENDPNLKAYNTFQQEFGNDRVIMLAFKNDSSILTSTCLNKIARLERALLNIEGVREVVSVLSAKDFRRLKGGGTTTIAFTSWFEHGPRTLTSSSRDSILSSPLITGRLINNNGHVAQLVIHLNNFEKIHDQMLTLIPTIRQACESELGKDNVHLSGADMITFGLNELSRKDFIKFTGLSYLLMFIVMGLLYQRVVYMLIAFVTAFSSLSVTLSIYGFFGYGLNIFTVMTPPLVIIISIINVMHIVNKFKSVRAINVHMSKEVAVTTALSEVVKPCFYASITTVIGFLSLTTSNTSILKEFGWLTAIGCLLAFVFSFLWSSLFLFLAYKNAKTSSRVDISITRVLGFLSLNIQEHFRFYSWVSVLIALVAASGAFLIKVDMYPLGYFPLDHSVKKDHEFMQHYWGKYYPIDMVLEVDSGINLRDPAVINAMLAFDDLLAGNAEVGNTISYVNVMERFAMISYRKELKEVMRNPFLAMSFGDRFTRLVGNKSGNLVSEDLTKARINITGSLLSVKELENHLLEIDLESKSIFENVGTLKVSGYPALFINMMNYAFSSMKSSLMWAFVFVFISMLFLLRSFKLSCIAIVPNLFPVLVLFGFLGFSNINLDLATCTVAAVILGIAIDDTIHILYRFREEKLTHKKSGEALLATHLQVGSVVVLTSLVLFIGFGVLLLASLKTVFYFGLLSMVSVVAVLYGDLVILTLILRKTKDG